MKYKYKLVKMLAIVMVIATAIYIATEVYAYSNSPISKLRSGIAYGAYLYEGEVPPPVWYTPEQLGAVYVVDWGAIYEENITLVHIVIPLGKEPFPIREVQPIFLYNGKFYQCSSLCVTPPLPSNIPRQPVGATLCGVGWFATGILWLKWRKKNEAIENN